MSTSLDGLIRRHELDELADAISEHSKPCLRGRVQEPVDPEAARSRIGGSPLVPTDFAWPTNRKGEPLTFHLQVEECPEAELNWGDAGTAFFWIPVTDLEQARFERVWFTWECG